MTIEEKYGISYFVGKKYSDITMEGFESIEKSVELLKKRKEIIWKKLVRQ